MPTITGSWPSLPQADFDALQPVANILRIGAEVGLPIAVRTTRAHRRETGQVVTVESPLISGAFAITVVAADTFTLDGTEGDGFFLSNGGRIFYGFFHFRPRGVTELDPFTKTDTGKTARELIQDLVDVHGWPLIGMFISGSGESTPHLAIHRSAFPSNPPRRPERLQDDLDEAMENIYKDEQTVTDPTDPDFGQTITARNFWVNTHVFNYRQDGLYVPGDFVFQVSNSQPSGQWWQG